MPKLVTQEPRYLTASLDLDLPSSERRVALVDAPSPAWLSGILDNAARGRPREFMDFLDLARERDGRLDSAAQRLEGAVSSLDWAVLPADVDDVKKDRAAEIALDASQMLQRLEYLPSPGSELGLGGFEDLLLDLSSAMYYGWVNPEVQWDYVERVGRWEPVRIAFRHPRRLAWDTSFRPRLYDPGARGPSGQYPGMELDPLRWLVLRGKVRPAYPTRDGLGRNAAWLYAFKRFSWKDWVQFSEQFGTPFVLGRAGANAPEKGHWDDDAMRILKDVVSKIRSRSRGVIDARDEIDILWPQVSGKSIVPAALFDACNDDIAILFLGATQGMDIRDKGTYASATVHKGVERDKVRRYGLTISNGISRGLIKGWYNLNYADGSEFNPAFWMNAEAPADTEAELKTDQGLYDLGYPLLKSDLADRYNRPLPDEDAEEDDILERQAAPNPFAGIGEEPEEGAEGEEGKAAASTRPRAPLILAEKPEDFDEDAAGEVFEGSVSEYVEVADEAAVVAREAAVKIATSWVKDQATDPGVTVFAQEIVGHLGPEYAQVIGRGKFKPVVEALYERFKLDTTGWPRGIGFDFGPEDLTFTESLGTFDKFHFSKYIKGDESEQFVRSFLEDWYGEKGGNLFDRMKAETLEEFAKGLEGRLAHLHKWQAKRIINTSVARVRGYADVQQMMDASVAAMQWYAPSGEREACKRCGSLHGTQVSVAQVHAHMMDFAKLEPEQQVQRLKDLSANHPVNPEADEELKRKYFEQYGYMQPLHPNCKCIWIMVFSAAASAIVRPRGIITMSQRWRDWKKRLCTRS